ncbi:MAG TPA: PEP-CTERM sorting domain-containing protein [Nitrosomonas mobilis]|nr:PEP-CTERM sorting domain-containing protein [Nitrosomonas mobilis]
MKLNKLASLLSITATALLLGAPLAQAVPFIIDTKLGSANLGNSSDADELNLIRSLSLDNTLTLDFKIDSGNTSFNATSNGTGSWFIDVAPAAPGYFLLKFGTGGITPTPDSHYVFQNIGELDKLVWSNDQVNFLTGGNCGAANQNACNIGRLSHYVGTNGETGTPSEIPEPMSLLLIGTGLLGFAATRRRRLV